MIQEVKEILLDQVRLKIEKLVDGGSGRMENPYQIAQKYLDQIVFKKKAGK